MFLEISQNSQENTCARASFLIKLQALGVFHRASFFIKHLRLLLLYWNTSTKISLLLVPTEAVAQRCSLRKGVFRNFAKFTGKHQRQKLFFNFIKKRLWRRCFPVNFAKFLRTPFVQNTSGRLLLYPFSLKTHLLTS